MASSIPAPAIMHLAFLAIFFSVVGVGGGQDTATDAAAAEFIRRSCNATLHPALCCSSMLPHASKIGCDPVRLAHAATAVSLAKLRAVRLPAAAGGSPALRDCAEVLGRAEDQTRSSVEELARLGTAKRPEIARGVSDAQTWLSATLTDEETCTDEIGKDGAGAGVSRRVQKTKEYTSNALALVNLLVSGS